MLGLPEYGMRPSVRRHNCSIDVVADWIEASALLLEGRITRSDVVDTLCENHVYKVQDFAHEFLDHTWAELERRRSGARDGWPFGIDSKGLAPALSWRHEPVYLFCLTLSMAEWFPTVAIDADYSAQGELFERIASNSLERLGWRLLRTGWSRTKSERLNAVVERVGRHLGEEVRAGAIKKWASKEAKDAGLDLVCDRPFIDTRGGHPLYFFQCASGSDWRTKTRTPDLPIWEKLLDFSSRPQRGFALPYVLDEHTFRSTCCSVDGVVIDRLRLVAVDGVSPAVSLDSGLRNDVISWLEPRVIRLLASAS